MFIRSTDISRVRKTLQNDRLSFLELDSPIWELQRAFVEVSFKISNVVTEQITISDLVSLGASVYSCLARWLMRINFPWKSSLSIVYWWKINILEWIPRLWASQKSNFGEKVVWNADLELRITQKWDLNPFASWKSLHTLNFPSEGHIRIEFSTVFDLNHSACRTLVYKNGLLRSVILV